MLYVVFYEVGFRYFINYKMITFGGAATTAMTALTSILGNQREFLSILCLNRVRAYYVASREADAGELLALTNNAKGLKWFFFGFAAIIFVAWIPRL